MIYALLFLVFVAFYYTAWRSLRPSIPRGVLLAESVVFSGAALTLWALTKWMTP